MTHKKFNEAIAHIRDVSLDTLIKKNNGYSKGSEDALHNFWAGAQMNDNTRAQTAWGYMTKHLVALRDKVQSGDFDDLADLEEKCQDIINYTAIIYAIGVEESAFREEVPYAE